MNQASLNQQVGIALTKKVIELSVNPNLGKNVDISI